jgi:dTDP-4-dehydrorhamnose reductase
MKALIVGKDGQVAQALAQRLPKAGFSTHALGRNDWAISDPTSVAAQLGAHAPALVINAAAYTAVDAAEEDLAEAYRLNAVAAGVLARACASAGAAFIHFSTDYVFDGAKGAAYQESDATAPLGVYGRSKLAGEREVEAARGAHLIFRTAWVCSGYGKNFLRTMLRIARERDTIDVVDDQVGAPTFADDIADAIGAIAPNWIKAGSPSRLLHMAGNGHTSWCGFARAIMEEAAARGWKTAQVNAITTAQFPTRAQRPADSRLDAAALEAAFGLRLPHWRTALQCCLDRNPELGA